MKKRYHFMIHALFPIILCAAKQVETLEDKKGLLLSINSETPESTFLKLCNFYREHCPQEIVLKGLKKGETWSTELFAGNNLPKIETLRYTVHFSGFFLPKLALDINKLFIRDKVFEYQGFARKKQNLWHITICYKSGWAQSK